LIVNKNNKRKATMLLYQLEESLGTYVIEQKPAIDNLPNKTVENIIDRNENKIDKSNIKDLIGATYLDEIFHFALEATKNTSMYNNIQELRELFISYDIYSIRNILAHPNRSFRDEHWYKIAVVAASPLIEIIGLDGVKEALLSAEEGKIEDPPEEWLAAITRGVIKNNLPSKFEHSITGLVGRTSEEKELLKLLKNSRIPTIGVIASGGIGKTALVLDMLNNLVLKDETAEWCDGIIYLDMKLEKLTKDGVTKLKAIETIEEIERDLIIEINNMFNDSIATLDELYKKYGNQKLLIFIDNLETLIRDYMDSFENFNLSLPREWRLLVTSRISISSASIIPLKTLNEKSAIHLARTYISKSGEESLSEENYKEIVKSCHYNPLAIRLTLDLYISGNGLPTSIDVSNKMIAEFSFQNLINILSENSIKVLEALFVESNINRLRLSVLLNLTLDEIAQSIHELSKTSLIVRNSKNDTEFFALSSSIRDLLLSSPKNIEIRSSIQEQINQSKVHSQEIDRRQDIGGVDEFNIKYIPKNIDPNLKILINKLNHAFRAHRIDSNMASKLFKDFSDGREAYEHEYIYQRAIGRLYYGLKDIDNALLSYSRALEINKNDYVSMHLLANTYFHGKKDYEESEKIYNNILNDKEVTNKVIKEEAQWFLKKILNGYFLSLLYQHKYEVVLRKTEKWQSDNTNLKGILGTYRASAWRRKIETLSANDTKGYIEAIDNSILIFDIIFNQVGYINIACTQALKVFDDIASVIHREDYKLKYSWLEFIAKHIINISNTYDKIENDYADNLIKKLSKIDIEKNVFKSQRWLEFTKHKFNDVVSEEYAIENQYLLTKIINIPTVKYGFPNYLFVEDKDKNSFCVHYSSLINKDLKDWESLELGMKLAIQPEKADNTGHSDKSRETRFLI
jgi:tetratricopeptide (TPR) repeat protein